MMSILQPRSFVILCFLAIFSLHLVRSQENPEDKEFLYLLEKPEDVYPIQEYRAKPRRDGKKEQPKFLYDATYPYPRVVEFYAR